MSKFNPSKLSVEFKDGVTPTEPIIPRRYTLTHSDITAELFLTIGKYYDFNKINDTRDEVLGEWILLNDKYFFTVNLHLDGPNGLFMTPIRDKIFVKELPLALKAIRYGDNEFFNSHLALDLAPIIVYFNSADPKFNRIENWGTFSDYNVTRIFRDYEISSFIKLSNSYNNKHDLVIYINEILIVENLSYRSSTEPIPYSPGKCKMTIFQNNQNTVPLIQTVLNILPNYILNVYIVEINSQTGIYTIPQPIK